MVVWRAAVIGCGRKGLTIDDEGKSPTNYSVPPSSHSKALARRADIELVAAADPDDGARRRMDARFPNVTTYPSYESMLAAERLDIVTVATQTPLHGRAVIAAAEAGARGIVCEKAMATSAAEADSMIAACMANRTVLAVDHPRRYHPTYQAVRLEIEAGTIGPLRFVIGTVGHSVIHNGTHILDLFRYFLGDPVSIRGSVRRRPEGDGDGWVHADFGAGRSALLDASSDVPISLTLMGEAGRIEIDTTFPGYFVTSLRVAQAESAEAGPWYADSPRRTRRTREVPVAAVSGTFDALLDDLTECIGTDRQPLSSGSDGARALEMALAAFASTDAGGGEIPLPLQDRSLKVLSR